MNEKNNIISNESLNKILDFSTVELSAIWPNRDEFFNGFPRFAPLFTYQIPYDGGAAFAVAENLKLNSVHITFSSPDEFLSAGKLNFTPPPLGKKSRAFSAGVKFGPGGGQKLAAVCNEFLSQVEALYATANAPTVRLYAEPHTYGEAAAFVNGIYDRLASGTGARRLFICFGGRSAAGIIELNRRIAADYPGIRGALHIEASAGLDRVSTALLFWLKFSEPLLAECTIAPVFAGYERGAPHESRRASPPRPAPTPEPESAYLDSLEILRSLEFTNIPGVFFISCPTCSRCRIDIISLANNIYRRVRYIETPLKIAVMGCEVNGPGEASHADIGIAGSPAGAVIFERGKIVERASPEEAETKLMERITRHAR